MGADDDAFCAVVLRVIEQLAPAARDRLREHVDWVEAYEMEEAREAARPGSRR